MLIDTLANPLIVASQAAGKVKKYQSVVGGTLLLIVPMAYIVLKLGGNPESVFLVHLLVAIVAQALRVLIISRIINMSLYSYWHYVLTKVLSVCMLSILIVLVGRLMMPQSVITSLMSIAFSVMVSILIVAVCGLTSSEREIATQKVKSFVSNLNHAK